MRSIASVFLAVLAILFAPAAFAANGPDIHVISHTSAPNPMFPGLGNSFVVNFSNTGNQWSSEFYATLTKRPNKQSNWTNYSTHWVPALPPGAVHQITVPLWSMVVNTKVELRLSFYPCPNDYDLLDNVAYGEYWVRPFPSN